MIRRYLILSVFSLHALSGCSVLTPLPQNSEMLRAESLLQNGQNKEAAAIYQQLANSSVAQQDYYRLLTADAFIRANDIKQAKYYLNKVDSSGFDEVQLNHFNLLRAEIALSQGQAETALMQLKNLQTELLNNSTKIAYYQSLAFAYSLTGDPIQSAQALTNLDSLSLSAKMRNKYYEQILSTLNVLSEEDLYLKQPLANDVLNGWMSLAHVFKLGSAKLNDNLLIWQKQYPVHPANSAFLSHYLKHHYSGAEKTALIAVFLPESGSYAAPAAVIKKGFMKAYKLAKKNATTHDEVRFYDSEKDSPAHLYQQAIQDGARLVVGPLDKKQIKELVNNTQLSIPVLALNYVEGLTQANLYQFGLSPVDDAEQITLKAHQDGHQNALFLVPKSEQGKRFAKYFTDNWKTLGGTTLKVQSYDDSKSDFSQLSQQIAQQNSDETEMDAIIINAYAKPARLLSASLRKVDVPIYATSQVYLGDSDAARDKKLEGITFCDVPWVFSQAYSGGLSKFALHDSWQDIPPSYLRLLPMGIDAYHLTEHLTELKNQPISGATGKLKLNGENRITRELFCAKFVNGVAKAIDFANGSLESESVSVEKQPASTTSPALKKNELPKLPNLDDVINLLPVPKTNNAVVQ